MTLKASGRGGFARLGKVASRRFRTTSGGDYRRGRRNRLSGVGVNLFSTDQAIYCSLPYSNAATRSPLVIRLLLKAQPILGSADVGLIVAEGFRIRWAVRTGAACRSPHFLAHFPTRLPRA